VKAAVDRPGNGQTLPSNVVGLANLWSGMEDAWVITTVPPSALAPAGLVGGNVNGLFQQVQQAAAGVKFGDSVVGTAQVTADTAANATQMANLLQFVVNLAQMQAQNNSINLAQAVAITTQGATVKVTVTLPEAQFQQLLQQGKSAAPHAMVRK